MNQQSEISQSSGLAQLAESKRGARQAPAAEADGAIESVIATVADPSPWQFRLRGMLALVAALSGLFAIMQLIGAVWSSILVWFLLLAVAHVTANFWGTRVAPRESQSHSSDSQDDVTLPARPSAAAIGAVRLSECRRPGWPMLLATAVGTMLGGTLGSVALVLLSLDRAGYAGVLVGTVSAAAVGGFLGFLTSSFAEIAVRAWKEAVSGGCEE